MQVKELYLGKPQNHTWEGQSISTSIFRDSVQEIEIKDKKILNCEQSDYKYHGGKFKEVYSFGLEDYAYWKKILGNEFESGSMGENITTVGLDESQLFVGDQLQFGEAILEVVQPRVPCLKLNIRLNRKDGIKLFLASKKYGVYYKVIKDGLIKIDSPITLLERDKSLPQIRLHELLPVLLGRNCSDELREKILSLPETDPRLSKRLI